METIKKILISFILLFSPLLYSYEYELSLCAIFQNEAPYLKEWIDFHRVVGVQHFWLYNNRSTDSYLEVLQPYIEKGIVELIEWPHVYTDMVGWNRVQCGAYEHATRKARNKSKWLMVIDTDEFFFPVEHENLIEFLSEMECHVCICANWQMYGTSHVAKLEKDDFLIEKLTLKALPDYQAHVYGKCIVRPEYIRNFKLCHFPNLKRGCYVTADGLAFLDYVIPTTNINKLRINHYWMRDEYFMLNFKFPRRINWQKLEEFESSKILWLRENDKMNQIEDKAIYRFLPKLKELYYSH